MLLIFNFFFLVERAGRHFGFFKRAGRHEKGTGRRALQKKPRQNTGTVFVKAIDRLLYGTKSVAAYG